MLKYVILDISQPIAVLLKIALSPSILTRTNVLPILQNGHKTNVENYRAISIVRIFSKLFENVINIKLENC